MSGQVYEQLNLFREGFLVSRSPLPGSIEARKMTVTSGLKCFESSKSFGPLGSLAKMLLGSSIWHSTRCFLNWKTSVTKRKHLLFRLAVSTHGIRESGSALWPTPTTGAALCAGTGSFQQLKRLAEKGMISEEERRNLSQGNGGKSNPEWIEWMMGFDRTWTGLIPTPVARTYKGTTTRRYIGGVVLQDDVRRSDRDFPGRDYWETEPDVGRVADGIPNRVDRLKCLGNAVVPQQFYPVFRAIAMLEEQGSCASAFGV